MPTMIACGAINASSPQQNAGVFLGQVNITGWDANMKINLGHGAFFGFFNYEVSDVNTLFDNLEWMDGVIFDQDMKISWNSNI